MTLKLKLANKWYLDHTVAKAFLLLENRLILKKSTKFPIVKNAPVKHCVHIVTRYFDCCVITLFLTMFKCCYMFFCKFCRKYRSRIYTYPTLFLI